MFTERKKRKRTKSGNWPKALPCVPWLSSKPCRASGPPHTEPVPDCDPKTFLEPLSCPRDMGGEPCPALLPPSLWALATSASFHCKYSCRFLPGVAPRACRESLLGFAFIPHLGMGLGALWAQLGEGGSSTLDSLSLAPAQQRTPRAGESGAGGSCPSPPCSLLGICPQLAPLITGLMRSWEQQSHSSARQNIHEEFVSCSWSCSSV